MTEGTEARRVIEVAHEVPDAVDAAMHGGVAEGIALRGVVNRLRTALAAYDERGRTDREALRGRLGVEVDDQGRVTSSEER